MKGDGPIVGTEEWFLALGVETLVKFLAINGHFNTVVNIVVQLLDPPQVNPFDDDEQYDELCIAANLIPVLHAHRESGSKGGPSSTGFTDYVLDNSNPEIGLKVDDVKTLAAAFNSIRRGEDPVY